jgi:predicted AlkP superfamily phosphohydrolase/phosphomutase
MRLLLLLLLCLSCGERTERSLVVIAIDGMDPELLRKYSSEGRMPNLTALAARGSFFDLATSNPPQSPVAWSTFITGHHSEVHGIYDFLHRDPHTMTPYLSTSKAEGPSFVLDLGEVVVPFGGSVELLREGEPFWSDLADAGLPVTVVSAPANYPPVEPSDARVLSGMGTPDLLGTPGLFQVFTTDPALIGKELNGGRMHPLVFDSLRRGTAELDGPPNPFSQTGEPMRLPIELITADRIEAAMLRIGDERRILRPGDWTDWIPLSFSAGPLVPAVRGMVRAHLVSLGEKVTLYLSPVNLDPFAPAQPISSPPGYAAELAHAAGRYYTQGMPEDTKGLASGVLTDDQFVAQSRLVLAERKAMLDHELDGFEGGFLFMYFSEVDLVSHMFWRAIEPDASEADRKYAHVLPELYGEMDEVVGDVVTRVGDRAAVMVMSDHGFTSYRRKVHLNAWLTERGYLVPAEKVADGPLGHVDWSKTRAYAMGLNLLYLNRVGREPGGVVNEAEADWLLARIQQELEDLRDPETGARVVTRTFRPERTHHEDRVPDLIVGYARGYRAADDSALGQIGPRVIEPNRDKWSGDHCIDPAHVPGILITSEKLDEREWSLADLGGWIRSYFGL